MFQFLVEAATLTLVGCLIGMALGALRGVGRSGRSPRSRRRCRSVVGGRGGGGVDPDRRAVRALPGEQGLAAGSGGGVEVRVDGTTVAESEIPSYRPTALPPFRPTFRAMPLTEALRLALPGHLDQQAPLLLHPARHHRLRGLPGRRRRRHPGHERVRQGEPHGAMIGTNAFQVRRAPISVGLLDDEQVRDIAKRPLITVEDARGRRGGPCPTRRPWRSSRAGRRRWATSRYRDRTVGNVLHLRRHAALPGGAGLPASLAGVAAHRARRPRAAPGGRSWATRSPRSCSTIPARAVGKKVRLDGREVIGQGRDRAEGARAGAVVRRLRAASLQHLRDDLRPAEDHRGVGEDADRRGDRAGAMARAEEAMRIAHRLRPGRGQRLHGGQGRRAGRLLEAAHQRALHRHPGRGVRSASWSAASSS